METNSLFEYLKSHYEYILILIGIVILIGVVQKWEWIVVPTVKEKNSFFINSIFSIFGEHRFRVWKGICGVILIISGIIFLVFK